MLGLGGHTPDEKVMKLIEAVEQLKRDCDVPPTLKEIIGADKEAEYMAALDQLAEDAFDDQCTGTCVSVSVCVRALGSLCRSPAMFCVIRRGREVSGHYEACICDICVCVCLYRCQPPLPAHQ